MKQNRSIKRKGFTLVELLIVIVVIGVLSAMMMLSSTEAVSSARASNIISNLRNWKTAALAWYVDHIDDVDKGTDAYKFGTGDNAKSKDIAKYLNSQSAPGYNIAIENNSWFVTYSGSDLNSNVAGKLNSRRKSVGISGNATSKDASTTDISNKVYMYIR